MHSQQVQLLLYSFCCAYMYIYNKERGLTRL